MQAASLQTNSGDLLVVTATGSGLYRPLRVLIDSGASNNFIRRTLVNGDANLKNIVRDSPNRASLKITLANGASVRGPHQDIDLRLNFEDFREVERFTLLDLNDQFDAVLGMEWLEKRQPYIDWKNKTVMSTATHESSLHFRALVGQVLPLEDDTHSDALRQAASYPISRSGDVTPESNYHVKRDG